MSNQKIIENVIRKSNDSGYEPIVEFQIYGSQKPTGFQISEDGTMVAWRYFTQRIPVDIEQVIFDPAFAKALWGDGKTSGQDEGYDSDELDDDIIFNQDLWHADDGLNYHGKLWQYHLQQMVILSRAERIEYLRENSA